MSILEVPRVGENIALDYAHLLDRLQGRLSFVGDNLGGFLGDVPGLVDFSLDVHCGHGDGVGSNWDGFAVVVETGGEGRVE